MHFFSWSSMYKMAFICIQSGTCTSIKSCITCELPSLQCFPFSVKFKIAFFSKKNYRKWTSLPNPSALNMNFRIIYFFIGFIILKRFYHFKKLVNKIKIFKHIIHEIVFNQIKVKKKKQILVIIYVVF